MDESNFLEEIRTWEHPPRYGSVQFKEKVTLVFLEDQKCLFHHRHHVEPRVKLYSSREESFPIPLKYIDVSRTTHTNLDVMQEGRIDDWNIDGSRDLSDPWTVFTQFTLLEEKPPDGYMWSGERLTRKQLTSRPDHLWPELWKSMGKNAKLKEKQKWSEEKLHPENAWKLRGIYFIDPEDKEFKETIKNARKKLETPMALAMPCRIMKINKNCGSGASNKIKSRLACILGSLWIYKTAYGRIIAESSWRPYCRKGWQFTAAIKIWFTNLILCLKPWKFQQQRQQWTRNGKNCVEPDESQKWERGDRWSKDQEHKSSFCLTVGHLSFEECCIGGKALKIQKSSCTARWYCERRFGVLCSIHWTRIISITNDSSKSHGYCIQTARVRRTKQLMQCLLIPR